MLKLLGSILIIGASAALGLAVRQQSVLRVRALTEWIDCINLLILEIGGQGTPLLEAFLVAAKSRNRLIVPVFLELTKRISGLPEYDFRIVWRDVVSHHAETFGFSTNETELLIGVADFLGRYDSVAQTRSLQTTMLRLTELRDDALSELRSRGSLYRTCGAAFGILLVLILV